MFEQNGITYTLKFTQQKLKTIETITKVSVVGEITRANGFMPYNILESLFSFALIEEQTKEVVKQSKATEMFEQVVKENGLATTNMAIVEKLQEDLGFMFR